VLKGIALSQSPKIPVAPPPPPKARYTPQALALDSTRYGTAESFVQESGALNRAG